MFDTLIITSCTGSKSVHHPNQLTLDDFRNPDRFKRRSEELRLSHPELALSARQMYTGRQHEYVLAGVDHLRRSLGNEARVELRIISAGYGLLEENQTILPYEATFNGMSKKELDSYSREILHLHEKVQEAIQGFDLVLFLLGDTYLRALGLPLESRNDQALVFVAGTSAKNWFPVEHSTGLVCFGKEDARVIGGGLVGLKGMIIRHLAASVATAGSEPRERLRVLQGLAQNPKSLRKLLRVPEQKRLALPITRTQRKTPTLVIPSGYARNAGKRPLFFIPDWDDLVNPDYDFLRDDHPQGRFDPYEHGVYAHDIFKDSPAYDGILISRAVIDSSNKRKRARFQDAHEFLRWPRSRPLMGDCGAFSYVKETEPPYSTEDLLQYYDQHGFDLGVSVDHLIIPEVARTETERKRRFQLTLKNAEEFLRKHREGGYSFSPMGVAQGWDIPSYRRAVEALLEMGYRAIALGGLARATSQFVVDLLADIHRLFPEGLYVHLFGVAREELLEPYARFGVTAFDSATFLRRAWMSARDNYLHPQTGKWYTAIRIPPHRYKVAGHYRYHKEIKPLIESGRYTTEQVQGLEQEALRAVRAYAAYETSLEAALESVMAYDALVYPGRNFEALYRETLSDRPWEHCDCPICQSLNAEVVVFRGNDRNRRRGFHNNYAFRRLKENRWDEISERLAQMQMLAEEEQKRLLG